MTETVEEEVCETVVRRECSTSTQQICRTEECTTQFQTVCDNQLTLARDRVARQRNVGANQGRTFGKVGISANLGGGLGFGGLRRPGVSGNIGAGININTGSLKKNSGTGAGRNCRSVLKKICVKLENEVCSAVVETGGRQCRDVPSQQCGTVERRVPRQRCVTVRERCIQTPRTQCKPVER